MSILCTLLYWHIQCCCIARVFAGKICHEQLYFTSAGAVRLVILKWCARRWWVALCKIQNYICYTFNNSEPRGIRVSAYSAHSISLGKLGDGRRTWRERTLAPAASLSLSLSLEREKMIESDPQLPLGRPCIRCGFSDPLTLC